MNIIKSRTITIPSTRTNTTTICKIEFLYYTIFGQNQTTTTKSFAHFDDYLKNIQKSRVDKYEIGVMNIYSYVDISQSNG